MIWLFKLHSKFIYSLFTIVVKQIVFLFRISEHITHLMLRLIQHNINVTLMLTHSVRRKCSESLNHSIDLVKILWVLISNEAEKSLSESLNHSVELIPSSWRNCLWVSLWKNSKYIKNKTNAELFSKKWVKYYEWVFESFIQNIHL